MLIVLFAQEIFSQAEPYLENNCFAPIDRYLARTIHMSGLVNVNTKYYVEPGDHPCNFPDFIPGAGCDPDYAGDCKDFNGYCPTRYWNDINLCVELKAATAATQ